VPDAYEVRTIALEFRYPAPRARVWRALVRETARWWPKEYFGQPGSKRMVLEPRLGGRFYEDAGGGEGLLWFHVIGVRTEESLVLAGDITSSFGGPVRSTVTLALEEAGKECRLRLRDEISGRATAALEGALREGWKRIFDGALRAHLAPPRRRPR
jgi:uncharacterized protein YndB with AHSA1/START domain